MKVLVINCGSSTLKFQIIKTNGGNLTHGEQKRLAQGNVDRIGRDGGSVYFTAEGHEPFRETVAVADHAEATRRTLEWLSAIGLSYPAGFEAIGHRVVHGGSRFIEPTFIDDAVTDAIDELRDLAPLHNGPAVAAIRAARKALNLAIPMVAVFDTAFHHSVPERASLYAIPQELAAKHQVRRYGFHGLAHRYMAECYAAITAKSLAHTKLITLQLGNGCSATAIEAGRSVDTSMGFTPLEGLIMGTRSGDVDPSLVGFLARQEGVSTEEVEGWLNTKSGLLGISASSPDMRDLLESERQGDLRAALAVEMFCYRARKYVGAYLAVLGGADAVLFGGGIGENAPSIRARICAGLDWCGLALDGGRNASVLESPGRISADDARIQAYVISVDEEVIIAQDTALSLGQRRSN
jgi:acetate kinase